MGKIAEHSADSKAMSRVPFGTRQSLSLFLGMPLDSLLSHTGIAGLHAMAALPPLSHQQAAASQGKPTKFSVTGAKALVAQQATPSQARAIRR
jgi:hypothetical protein